MKNGKVNNYSIKNPSKSPGKKNSIMKTNQNVRHSYFSVLRNLTKDKSSVLIPSVEKRSPKYLEDLYTKYSSNLEIYLINNKRDIKLYGSKRYENESFDSILNDIKSNKGKVIEKLRNKPLPCSITEYDDDKIILTPLPNKSRQTLESSKDKEEFFNAERQAVVMRTVEYTHAVRNKQSINEENIKALRDFEQHSNDKSNRLMMLKLFKKPVNVIETWWFSLKNKRNKVGSDNNVQVNRHKTTPQEENTLNFIDNYNDLTSDYGFNNTKYNIEQSKINNTMCENKERPLATRVIFNKIQSKERDLFQYVIQALLDSCVDMSIISNNNSNEKDHNANEKDSNYISKAKLLVARFIFNILRDKEKNAFNKLISFRRGQESKDQNTIIRHSLGSLIITNECCFKIKGIKRGFLIYALEEKSEYYFELLVEDNNACNNNITQKKSVDNVDNYCNNNHERYQFNSFVIEYKTSFQIEGEEAAFVSHYNKNEDKSFNDDYNNNNLAINSFSIDYIESIQISPDIDGYSDDHNSNIYYEKDSNNNDNENHTKLSFIQNKISYNEWAFATKETFNNMKDIIECVKFLQNYYRCNIKANQNEIKSKNVLHYDDDDQEHYYNSHNQHSNILSHEPKSKLIKLIHGAGNEDIIHRVRFDSKSFAISIERKIITIINQKPKSRNENNRNSFKPTKSEDIQIHPKRNQKKEEEDNNENNKSFEGNFEKTIRDKLLKNIVTNKNKKINKQMKELEESYQNSSSRKMSLLQFAKRKLIQVSAMHFNRHFHDYFSDIISYQKPPSPLILVLDIYNHYSLYPRFIKWNQNSQKTVYFKKRINEVSKVIHLQITKRKLLKLLSVIGRSARQSFFYRMILIYIFSNDIHINYNPLITFINKGFANQYMFSLANALSLDLTQPKATYERHAFLPYIKQLVNLSNSNSNDYYSKSIERLNNTTNDVPKEHLNWVKEDKEQDNNQREHSVDDILNDIKPEEKNAIMVKTISLKKK